VSWNQFSTMLSTKEDRKTWVEPVIDPAASDGYRFEVKNGKLSKADEDRLKKGTKTGRGTHFSCVLSGSAITPDFVREEGLAGRLGAHLMAIVAEGERGRTYLAPVNEQEDIASSSKPGDTSGLEVKMPNNPRWFSPPGYGMKRYVDLFTPRQLVALTTFSDLVSEARGKVLADAHAAGLVADEAPLHAGGTGAAAYAEAVATYLAFAVSKASTRSCVLTIWEPGMGRLAGAMGRQALPMQWNYAETNPLAGAGGDIEGTAISVAENLHNLGFGAVGGIRNLAAQRNNFANNPVLISTDPPYYDNIGYADLSDFFYVWLKRSLGGV
jgi:putative DNA methylase